MWWRRRSTQVVNRMKGDTGGCLRLAVLLAIALPPVQSAMQTQQTRPSLGDEAAHNYSSALLRRAETEPASDVPRGAPIRSSERRSGYRRSGGEGTQQCRNNAISTGLYGNCFVKEDSGIQCWGVADVPGSAWDTHITAAADPGASFAGVAVGNNWGCFLQICPEKPCPVQPSGTGYLSCYCNKDGGPSASTPECNSAFRPGQHPPTGWEKAGKTAAGEYRNMSAVSCNIQTYDGAGAAACCALEHETGNKHCTIARIHDYECDCRVSSLLGLSCASQWVWDTALS